MNSKIYLSGLLALGLSGLTASACFLPLRVACPNDKTASGIKICVTGVGCVETDNLGTAVIDVGGFGTFTVCVDTTTLPPGATLNQACQKIKVTSDAPPLLEFQLGGDFCSTPPPPGPCWLTGGGTIDKTKGTPNYSFGGVVYPGCSPKAADGGNWNVVDHATGLHFQGQHIIVDYCRGVPTRSPKVTVNVIRFHGEGVIKLNGQNSPDVPVSFVGLAIDNSESGGGSDMLFLSVTDGASILMQIGASEDAPATISTGNLQIHQTSCND
ncbi:MAG TPA: hypothetical protein VNM37_12840 [Candidatus Dormibacteraeota bacterium]|nr:hypothetical protein [Candidatus Dormibacteraeota bacterium]